MFDRKSINGSVRWIGVPNFQRNDGPTWTLNTMAPYTNWGDRGYSTSLNLVSDSGRYSNSISIKWNFTARVLPIYDRRIFENTRSAARCACGNLLTENRIYRMQIPYNCRKPTHGCLVNRRGDALDYRWYFFFSQ